MISIIVCSTNLQTTAALQQNVEEKIGVPFEIIFLDNSKNKYSIFSAYNEGVSRSKYDILCFMHEDVLIHTMDWGHTLMHHLRLPSVGIIGVCGCTTLARIPSPWSLHEHYKYLLQSTPTRNKHQLLQSGFDKSPDLKQVLVVDGVFMAAKKLLFEKIQFDENTFSGYHAYDIDICLQAHTAGFKNFAINDILIEHFSIGYHNKGWVINAMALSDKWKDTLPLSLQPFSAEHLKKIEYRYMTSNFVKYMIRAGYSNKECTQTIAKYLEQQEYVDRKHFARTIFLKTLLVRLFKKPLSFFPSILRRADRV